MINQINILGNDRDFSSVEKNRSEKEDKRVKLTGKSKKNVESKNKFLFSRDMTRMQTSLDSEEKADKVEKKLDNQDDLSLEEKAILNLQLTSLKSKQCHYSNKNVKPYNRAIAVKEFMKNNIINKFRMFCSELTKKLNVTEVNVPDVNQLFSKADKGNNTVGIDMDALDAEIRNSRKEAEQPVVDVVEENTEKKLEDSDSMYSYKKEDIIQDNIYSEQLDSKSPIGMFEKSSTIENSVLSNDENLGTNVPFSRFEKNSISDEMPISDALSDFNKDIVNISESINDSNVTIDDLEALRSALEQEKRTREELKNRLENQRIQEQNAEKEAIEAERQKKERIKFANEQLAAYRAENQKLKTQQMEVEQETQRKISARQAAMNQIAEINQMLAGGNLNNGMVNSDRREK